MSKYFLTTLLLSINCFLFGQNVDWLIPAGGAKSDKGSTIVVDKEGFIYETGYYNEEANFGPYNTGFSFMQSKEVYVAKMDPAGNYLWVNNGINYFDDRGLGLCVDTAGYVYVTGTCWGGLVWGSLNVYNPSDYTDQIFVIKMDPNGNEIWMKNAGLGGYDYPYNDDHGQDLAADSQGNIYVTGFLSNNSGSFQYSTFDTINVLIQPGDSLAFIAKLSADGNWQWVNTFEGIYGSRDNACAVDDEDNVYITGSFHGTSDFAGQNLNSYGKQDVYVIKYSPNGTFQWVSQAGSEKSDRGNGIIYGGDGHMYITGEFRDFCAFGQGIFLDNNGGPKGRDIFVAKINKFGDWIWASKAGSKKGSDKGIEICSNNKGNLFVTGQFSAKGEFGDLEVDSDGDSVDVFIAGIDTLGNWRWVIKGGGPDFDRGTGIAVDTSCNLYVTGFFFDSLTFESDSITSNLTSKDIFTVKVSDVCFGYDPPIIEEENEDSTIVDTGEVDILEIGDSCLFISSNVITANGDLVNDQVNFFDYCGFPVDIVIVNRWGRKVYESTDPNEYWDGSDQAGNPLSEGVYFWSILVKNKNGTKQKYHGFITLIRD